jgi:hypothetical protein
MAPIDFPVWAMASAATEDFGPFIKVPSEQIQPAGWKCKICRKPVRRFKQIVPVLIPRLVIHACKCGTAVCWEDEQNPNKKNWLSIIDLLKGTDTQIVIFNGDKETPPGFQGVN